ncbi:MAG TPA: hypothetical protein DEA26_08145 [Oceanospirillales bacterium]|nr:hypothetical protein [Oceanospirillaceae bacterium]MAR01967.1 hypothetical protein [Oceanospirillaceae bacterium]HBS42637.1 hypothetical protein [Oceanospirillales bacterium]|tara:strand:+ start:77023 stop:77520 length:498 start_codon:yes stop_codon:yes gene_type:complete
MNMLIRFFLLWLAGKTDRGLFSTASLHYRIQLHDMGWRDHLPNYRFFSFMELGRFDAWRGYKTELKQKPGLRMLAAQDMVYIRPVAFLAKLRMDTRLLSWDEKYVYFQHDFYVKNTLVATGLVKEACIYRGKKVAPPEMFDGEPPLTDVVEYWSALQNGIKNLSR